MTIRAVTLDAAGTLFAVAEPVGTTYARLAAAHGLAVTADDAERRFRAAVGAARPLAFPGASPGEVVDLERAWWRDVVRRALGAGAAAPAADAAFEALFAHYARPDAWRVFPEVPGVLGALRARGLGLAVLSNFDGRLPPLLAALGLAGLVDTVVHSTAVGSAKPDPAIFAIVLARLGVAPACGVHVGDDLDADVRGATGAGLRAMLVDRRARPAPRPACVRVLASLAELPGAVGDA